MGYPFTHKKKGGKYKTNKQTKLVKEVKEKRKNILSSNSLNTSVPSLPISPNSSLIMTMKKQFLGKFTTLSESLKNSTPRKGDNYIR